MNKKDIEEYVNTAVFRSLVKRKQPKIKVTKNPNSKTKKRHLLKLYGNCGARTNQTVWKQATCIGCLTKMLKAIKKINGSEFNLQDNYWLDCATFLEKRIEEQKFKNKFKDVVNEEV